MLTAVLDGAPGPLPGLEFLWWPCWYVCLAVAIARYARAVSGGGEDQGKLPASLTDPQMSWSISRLAFQGSLCTTKGTSICTCI